MGKVDMPQLSWRVLVIGAVISAVSAIAAGAMVYLLSDLSSATAAWQMTFSVVVILNIAIISAKLMQKRSARYCYVLLALFSGHLAMFLYFFLVPVFFVIPVASFLGGVIIFFLLSSFLVNAQMARRHFLSRWSDADSDFIIFVEGVRCISADKFAKSPDMKGAPSLYSFEPKWLSTILVLASVAAMILGFGLRRASPDFSMLLIGYGVVFAGGYFAQIFVVAFYKARIVGALEKKYGHLLVMDFSK